MRRIPHFMQVALAALAGAGALLAQPQFIVPGQQTVVPSVVEGGRSSPPPTIVRPRRAKPAVPKADEDWLRSRNIAGRELKASVDRVARQLRWHKTLSSALEAAKQTRKPVLWFQVLGDLQGYT